MALVGDIQGLYVVADMVADNDAVFEVVKETGEGDGFVEGISGFVASDAMDGDRGTVVVEFAHHLEAVFEEDFAVKDSDRPDGDQAVAARVEAGGFAVQDDEADGFGGRFRRPGLEEGVLVLGEVHERVMNSTVVSSRRR